MGKKITAVMILCVLVLGTLMAGAALATPSASGGLEWENALVKIVKSIQGPVALSISIVMLVAGCCGLAFGGDLSGWLRHMLMACLLIGVLGFSTNVLEKIFGMASGSLI